MKKYYQSYGLTILILSLLACSSNPIEPNPGDNPADWIAATARIQRYQQIVLINYDNPSVFKIITDNDHQNIEPVFSNDKTMLIYQDNKTGFVHDPQLVLYNLKNGKTKPLMLNKQNMQLTGEGVVWSPDDNAIYFLFQEGILGSTDIVCYDLKSETARWLTNTFGPSEWPVGFKGLDTLIAFSNNKAATKEPLGFYFMDLNANYLSRINNPHLELVNRSGINLKAAYHPEWNDELDLLVYAQVDSAFPGIQIAVTNLDGTFYKTYSTGGSFIDDYPCWGPNGKSILFQRSNATDYGQEYARVMLLNLDTETDKELIFPYRINKASSLSYPDY
ncbi:MAG: hypothetical protein ACFFCW_37015 [Candidatus Hodarchaeota archaeon]